MVVQTPLAPVLVPASMAARAAGACVLAISLDVLAGCGGIGPRSIAHDRFDYTETLSASWHWCWIDDRDLRSRSLFTFLMFIFSPTETQDKEGAPIMTIPAG